MSGFFVQKMDAHGKRNGTKNLPFKMPLYPIPVILAILVWIGIFLSTGRDYALSGLTVIGLGVIAYFLAMKYRLFEKVISN